MRISDWSSDVCSSDLPRRALSSKTILPLCLPAEPLDTVCSQECCRGNRDIFQTRQSVHTYPASPNRKYPRRSSITCDAMGITPSVSERSVLMPTDCCMATPTPCVAKENYQIVGDRK